MTRTSCTQIFNNKRICKPYNCSPFTAGLHEATDSTAVTSSGWEVESLLTQLGSANHRQMGDRDSERLSNSLCGPSSTGMQAKRSYILHRAKPDSRRSEGFVRKGCSPSLQPTTSREFLLNSLSGTQERRSNEASDKFEKAKRVGSAPTLQNGGHEYPKGTIKGKRLDGEDRPQGCILHRPNTPCSSALSKVHGKSTTLPVYMPPIRPVLCSMGVHKSDETHINLPSKYGGTYDCLHRRHTSDGGVPSAGEGPPGGINLSADRPGVCHQYTEVDHNPSPTNRIFGIAGRLNHFTPKSTRRETSSHQVRNRPDSKEKLSNNCKAACPDYRETACSISGSPPSSPVLQVPSGRPAEGSKQQQSELQFTADTIPASPGGVNLVARQIEPLEWQSTLASNRDYDHQVRCISTRLGSSVQWHQDRGTLESCRAADAHKLFGAVSSYISCESIPEGSEGSVSAVAAGQPDRRSIHQQYGGNSFPPADKHLQSLVDVGTIQGYCADRRIYSRVHKLCGGHRVQDLEGSNRLEAQSSTIQSNRSEPGSPGSKPVCFPPVDSTSSVFQLETRPNGRGNRCLQPTVGEPERLCESSMVPDRQGSVTSEEPTSSSDPGGSSLEGPTMVSSPAGDVVQLSAAASSVTEPIAVRAQRGPDGFSTPTSRVACLRQKFGCGNLSESAKELILSSWRGKTSRAYDSHFQKWLGWCSERGCDPISGPISDVVNFLADLHSQGYQTNSLNAYRSAISSVHDKVDDMDVGKHPLVARLLKGAFHARPPLPRYTGTWNVQVVLDCMLQWGDTTSLSLKLLTYKLVMLMSLARPSRSAYLASLCIDNCHYKPEGVVFVPSVLAKQSRQGKPLTEYFFAGFTDNRELCPVETLRQYQKVTVSLRKESTHLFVAIVKPHKPVAPCTIARWLKEVLKLSGFDTNIFTAHSTRSASSSAAADSGVTTSDILKAADWSSESVFRKFYYRPTHNPSYGRAVLTKSSSEA